MTQSLQNKHSRAQVPEECVSIVQLQDVACRNSCPPAQHQDGSGGWSAHHLLCRQLDSGLAIILTLHLVFLFPGL